MIPAIAAGWDGPASAGPYPGVFFRTCVFAPFFAIHSTIAPPTFSPAHILCFASFLQSISVPNHSLIVLYNPLVRFRTWMSRATRMNAIVTARSTPPSTRGAKTDVPDTAALKRSTR